jgi:hypothetical protein
MHNLLWWYNDQAFVLRILLIKLKMWVKVLPDKGSCSMLVHPWSTSNSLCFMALLLTLITWQVQTSNPSTMVNRKCFILFRNKMNSQFTLNTLRTFLKSTLHRSIVSFPEARVNNKARKPQQYNKMVLLVVAYGIGCMQLI